MCDMPDDRLPDSRGNHVCNPNNHHSTDASSTRGDTITTAHDGSVPTSSLTPAIAARLRKNDAGLVPAIAQEASTGDVLMLAWMDEEALARTLRTRRATYWSRSRQEYWVKGETSGHTQHVREVKLDCDADAILLIVDQTGPACHTGTHSCFDTDVLLHSDDRPSRVSGT